MTVQSNKNKRVKYYQSDDVLEKFYETLLDSAVNNKKISLSRVHIPRSDVFYVREAYFQATGNWESLDRIERCLYLGGHLRKQDVLDPDRVRDWEKDYLQFDEDYKSDPEDYKSDPEDYKSDPTGNDE